MYGIQDDQPTHRRRKQSGTVSDAQMKRDGTSSQLRKSKKEDDLHNIMNYSSSLTALSDHEDNFAGKPLLCPTAPEMKFTVLTITLSVRWARRTELCRCNLA